MKKRTPIIDIVVIGDELLAGRTIDSNSNFITAELARLGYITRSVSIVGDKEEDIGPLLRSKVKTARLIIITGGLGPTPDDMTRFAVAHAFDRKLVVFKSQIQAIRRRVKTMPVAVRRVSEVEAILPKGSTPLENRVGVAPGFTLKEGSCVIFCIPGVPAEARSMLKRDILPFVKKHLRKTDIEQRIIKTIGMRESEIYNTIKRHLHPLITIGMYPSGREVELRLKAQRKDRRALDKMYRGINKLLRSHIYSNRNQSIVETVAKILTRKGLTISLAESCSGGLIAKRLTDVSGSSAYFIGTIIAYSNALKEKMLGVRRRDLRTYGAVSPEVARAMVRELRRRTKSDIGISVTGIAGPGGGSKKKPVGLVYIGIAYQGTIEVKEFRFRGGREKVRWLASQAVMHEVWKRIR